MLIRKKSLPHIDGFGNYVTDPDRDRFGIRIRSGLGGILKDAEEAPRTRPPR